MFLHFSSSSSSSTTDNDLNGTIHITDNPQQFLNLITCTYKQNQYNCNQIWKSIKDDNINISESLSMSFQSLVRSITTPDDDIGLLEIEKHQEGFTKIVSIVDEDLLPLIIIITMTI
uniref:Uncharacterized protein n=1 Tax=Metapenaeus joyneri majanivirus TaxID=2984280 RepID=A0A9C7F0K4_9VIRU|nr:MAG: hypothetical protein [Metapenaeus joyneri majanivirus]